MKTHVLLLGAVCLFPLSKAMAQIPNGGFENWTTVGTYQDPTDWITFNSVTSAASAQPSCSQGMPGAVGNYYATVTTRNTSFGLVQGIITVGDLTAGTTGFPYASRPAAMTGQWQYGVLAGDSALVAVELTKWNSTTQTSDAVGAGAIVAVGNLSSWQTMNVPIVYQTSETPDTAFVVITSSSNSPVDGSFIKIDALAFGGTAAGISEEEAAIGLRAYPSPTTDILNVVAQQPIAWVSMMDMTGRTVLERSVNGQNLTFNVADLQSGRYLMQVRMADGKRFVRSFIKR